MLILGVRLKVRVGSGWRAETSVSIMSRVRSILNTSFRFKTRFNFWFGARIIVRTRV